MATILSATVHEFGLGLGAALLLSGLFRSRTQYILTTPAKLYTAPWLLLAALWAALLNLLALRRGRLERWTGGLLLCCFVVYAGLYGGWAVR